jgi:DNA mismatch repair protein MutS2
MIGLPSSVIENARERLGDRYGETDSLLAQLQKRMSEVIAQQNEVLKLRDELQSAQKAADEAAAKLDAERAKVGSKYREELERLRDDVSRQLSNELKNLRELDRAARSSINAGQVVKTLTTQVDRAIEFAPVEHREVHVGDRAEHRKLKVTGEVVSLDRQKAVINVNGRRMTVDVKDLVPLASPAKKAASRPRSAETAALHEEVSAELNLIGQHVDDALEESDKFLDRALLEGKQAVRIIHGFGTGTLRKAIREHLRKHPAVKSWRPGGENEGGDGATIAVLG